MSEAVVFLSNSRSPGIVVPLQFRRKITPTLKFYTQPNYQSKREGK